MFAACQLAPDFLRLRHVRKNQAANFAAANETVIPAKVMIKHEIENRGLMLEHGLPGALAHFGFETSSTERADDSSIGEEKRLRAFLLRTRTLHAGNDSQRERLTGFERRDQFVKKSFHGRRERNSLPLNRQSARNHERAGSNSVSSVCSVV